MAMNNKPKAEIIQPPSTLRDRVSVRNDEDVDFSAANNAIDDLAEEFVQRLPGEFKRIETAYAALQAMPDDESRRTVLFRLIHDLKGQAGTFDYQLITVIGNDLCRFIERPIEMSPRCLKVAGFYIDAMKRVAEKRMTGDGDEHGIRMIDTLHSMTQKVLQE